MVIEHNISFADLQWQPPPIPSNVSTQSTSSSSTSHIPTNPTTPLEVPPPLQPPSPSSNPTFQSPANMSSTPTIQTSPPSHPFSNAPLSCPYIRQRSMSESFAVHNDLTYGFLTRPFTLDDFFQQDINQQETDSTSTSNTATPSATGSELSLSSSRTTHKLSLPHKRNNMVSVLENIPETSPSISGSAPSLAISQMMNPVGDSQSLTLGASALMSMGKSPLQGESAPSLKDQKWKNSHSFSSSFIPFAASGTSSVSSTSSALASSLIPNGPSPASQVQVRKRRHTYASSSEESTGTIGNDSLPLTGSSLHSNGGQRYSCPFCHKSFARPYNLKSHFKTHSGDRPFKCDQCTMSFSRNHDLRRHQKIHLGLKPFRCQHCNKYFSRMDALTRHCANKGCPPP